MLMETSQDRGTPSLLKQEQRWQAWSVLHGCMREAVQFGQVRKGGNKKLDPNVYLGSDASSLTIRVMEAPGSVSSCVNRCNLWGSDGLWLVCHQMLILANCASGPWLCLTAESFLTGLAGLRAKAGPRTLLTRVETGLFHSPSSSFKTMKYKPGTGRDTQTL